MRVGCGALVLPGEVLNDVVLDLDADGAVSAFTDGRPDIRVDVEFDTAVPGFANTHSHAFHRLLRGRTNAERGDFWQWRTLMYDAAARLNPERMLTVASAVYAEMRDAGYSAVGEFHYVHHQPDGTAYPSHEMELAIAQAARDVGIRLTLLDTLYLTGGFGVPLAPEQARFGDGTATAWLERWHALRGELARHYPEVLLGAALHSARAVPEGAIGEAVRGLPAEVPLHVHVSEQTAENEACQAATGMTPAELLASHGALSARTTLVHATHLTNTDVRLIGDAGAFVSLCSTTEADLGDGLGMPEQLAAAGAALTIGSDQNVVVDPFAEVRGVEWMARLAGHRRGVFTTDELWAMGGVDGHRSLGALAARPHVPEIGAAFDLVELDARSARTQGSDLPQLLFSATAADVRSTIVRGRHRPVAATPLPLPFPLER